MLNKKKASLLISLLLVIVIYTLLSRCIIIIPSSNTNDIKYGIIDLSLSNEYESIIDTNVTYLSKKKSHGDKIMLFWQTITDKKVYYYSLGENASSDKLIEGLSWMEEKKVDCICISLSGKVYSSEIETWIEEHKDNIKIYASYNNKKNTFDYPATYKNVVGVGVKGSFTPKSGDVEYMTSHIIVFSEGFRYYYGNSFLTPYTMLKIDDGDRNAYETKGYRDDIRSIRASRS